MSRSPPTSGEAATRGSAPEVFSAFLQLGLTSFGGPIAHLGYFHREFVERRRWIDDAQYAQLVALCQFLPGPASSQFGFALGLLRAGWLGAIAAFAAFTLPSAILLLVFAAVSDRLSGPFGQAGIHGLKLVAVAVVADGVRRMARQLTPDIPRVLMAVVAAACVIAVSSAWVQLAMIVAGAAIGQWACSAVAARESAPLALSYGLRTGSVLLVVFAILLALALLPIHGERSVLAGAAAGFYQAGALVFGGGHVVVPLLHETVVQPGWIDPQQFLAGYGAAQAIPGPMFSVAAFLGAQLGDTPPLLGAAICLIAIFLPGLLLVSGALPWWRRIEANPAAARAMAGVNAVVVGILAAALYRPVWTSAIVGPLDIVIAVAAFALLAATRASTLLVVAWCVGAMWIRVAVGI